MTTRRGLDWIEVAVHVFVTICAAVALSEASNSRDDVIVPTVFGVSAVVFEVRRRLALRKSPPGLTSGEVEAIGRVEDLEQRITDLEAVAHRVAELEERVDFSERLLTQQRDRLLEKREVAE